MIKEKDSKQLKRKKCYVQYSYYIYKGLTVCTIYEYGMRFYLSKEYMHFCHLCLVVIWSFNIYLKKRTNSGDIRVSAVEYMKKKKEKEEENRGEMRRKE